MRYVLTVVSALALAACAPPEVGPVTGVGFESYEDYQLRREAELRFGQQTRRAPMPIASAPIAPPPTAIAANTAAPRPAPPAPNPVAPNPDAASAISTEPLSAIRADVQTAAVTPAPDTLDSTNPGISDEQDFSAVAARESIESDRARIAANRQQYQEVAPTALPQRSADNGPNIVEYALQATNSVGQSVYRRPSASLRSTTRACAAFASPDLAQTAFLRRGGPKRDPRRLDPDGDGFACSWDPTPFQKARGG